MMLWLAIKLIDKNIRTYYDHKHLQEVTKKKYFLRKSLSKKLSACELGLKHKNTRINSILNN